MPRIPQQNFGASTNLAGANVRSQYVGAAAQGTIQAGRELMSLGSQLGQIAKQKKEADDAAYVAESYNSIARKESEIFNEISTTGADIDLDSSRQEYDDRIKAAMEAAPSSAAREELKRQTDSLYNNKLSMMYLKHQSNKNVQNRKNSFLQAQDDIHKDIMLGRTSFEEAAGRNEAVLAGMENTLGGVIDIDAQRVNSYNKLTTSYLSERINKGESQQVISEIKAGNWDEYANANTLGRLVDTARNQISQQEKVSNAEYLAGANDYINFLKSGQDDVALAERYNSKEVKAKVKGFKGKKLADEIEDARAFGQVMSDIKDASAEDTARMIQKEIPKDAKDFTRESKQLNIMVRAAQEKEKAIEKDAAGYVNQNTRLGQFAFEELQDSLQSGDMNLIKQSTTKYNAVQKAQQVNFGVSPTAVRLLPVSMEDNYAAKLNDVSQGGEGVANQINLLKEIYGNDFSLVRNQLVMSGKLKSGITVLADMEASQEQIQLAEAVAVSDKDYKGFLRDEDYTEVKQETRLKMDKFAKTTISTKFFNEHRSAIEKLAMKLLVDGVTDDAGEAINSAKDKVLDDRYEFVGEYRIPKTYNSTNVEFGVQNIQEQLKNQEFDLLIPEDPRFTPEDTKELFYDKLVPYAHTTQDNKGISFTHKNGDAILKADGEPLVISFEELEKETPSLFERLFL